MKLEHYLPHYSTTTQYGVSHTSKVWFKFSQIKPKYYYRSMWFFGDGLKGTLSFNFYPHFCREYMHYFSKNFYKGHVTKSFWFPVYPNSLRNISVKDAPKELKFLEDDGWKLRECNEAQGYIVYTIPFKPCKLMATIEGETFETEPMLAAKLLNTSGQKIVEAANNNANIGSVTFSFEE